MAPPILKLDDICLTFGGHPLLDNACFQILPGEHVCLVGRNGSGKSTLLKIAAGLVEAQSGEVFRHPSATVRYLDQSPDFSDFKTVYDYAISGTGQGDDPHRVTYLLENLGLTGQEDPNTLSGGEARRAALVRVLAPQPDILLLDEPTNHLDLTTIEWLEREVSSMSGTVVIISHDRRFLENTTKVTFWLDRGVIKRLGSGFGQFEEWRDKVLEEEELDHHKLGRSIKREEHWLRYGVTARRKRNVRRLKGLFELRAQHKSHRGALGSAKVTTSDVKQAGKLIAEAKNINLSYGERKIVDNFSIRVHRGDKIGLVGPNGAGKSTLLNMLIGQLKPDDGAIRIADGLELAMLDQNRQSLDLDDTLSHYLSGGRGDSLEVGGVQRHVTGYMKDFLFQPEQARTPIRELSGGERARLMLARILAKPSNFLVLDEPTNDLDMETLDLLQEIIVAFQGTVILISHDRDFLDRTVMTTIAPENMSAPNGTWITFAGGYSDMQNQRRAEIKAQNVAKREAKNVISQGNPSKPTPKNKLSYKQKFALENLPIKMEEAEKKAEKMESKMAEPGFFQKDGAGFAKMATELEQLRTDLTSMENEWMELEMLREELGS